MPGVPVQLTASNAAQVLTTGQYAQFATGSSSDTATRHDFLQGALQAAFTKLSAGSLPSPQTLGADLGPLVRQGRLLFWSNHPAEQPLLRTIGLAGAFPHSPGSDLLAVTTQNTANNKIDAYLHRTIDDHVTFDPATGQTNSTVTVTLHNAAPASGLPPVVIDSYPGSGLAPGTNLTWLSLYSPLSLLHASEGTGVLAVSSVPELSVHTYSTHVSVGPGQTVTFTFHLSGRLDAGSTYSLDVRNQPTVNADVISTSVSPTTGWSRVGAGDVLLPAAPAENQSDTSHFRRS